CVLDQEVLLTDVGPEVDAGLGLVTAPFDQLHSSHAEGVVGDQVTDGEGRSLLLRGTPGTPAPDVTHGGGRECGFGTPPLHQLGRDRKSTRLNSSHVSI